MRKFAVVICAAIIVLTISTGALAEDGAQYLTRAEAVEEVIRALYSTRENTAFTFEDYYCFHASGYIHFVPTGEQMDSDYPVLCEVYNSVQGPGFLDTTLENENLSVFITLAKEMGIIHGYSDNTFRPENLITYNEAVKMLVCGFGYGGLGETRGGYPSGYVKAAEEKGVTQGISFIGNDKISAIDFKTMLANCLNNPYSGARYLMKTFKSAATPEQCAETYAQAVMDRCAAVQYALFDDELRGSFRDSFAAQNWITGVSSPSIAGYHINYIGDLRFKVIFHWAFRDAAAPKLVEDTSVTLTLRLVNGYYCISKLEYEDKTAVNRVKAFFEEPESRIFDMLPSVLIEDNNCTVVTVIGKTNAITYPIDTFAVDESNNKMYFLSKESGEYERFYTLPSFACKTFLDGKLRIESLGMYMDGPSGLHALREMRIIDTASGEVLWRDESLLDNRFLWSPDGRFVSAEYAGRTWRMADVIDTADMSRIVLPNADDILIAAPTFSKPHDTTPYLQLKNVNWVAEYVIKIAFEWWTEKYSNVFGSYEYNVLEKTMNITEIDEIIRG